MPGGRFFLEGGEKPCRCADIGYASLCPLHGLARVTTKPIAELTLRLEKATVGGRISIPALDIALEEIRSSLKVTEIKIDHLYGMYRVAEWTQFHSIRDLTPPSSYRSDSALDLPVYAWYLGIPISVGEYHYSDEKPPLSEMEEYILWLER